jgi:hypothetical protein
MMDMRNNKSSAVLLEKMSRGIDELKKMLRDDGAPWST